MDKEKRKELKEVATGERNAKIKALEDKIAKKRAFYEAEIAIDQEEIEKLKLEVEAFKGLK